MSVSGILVLQGEETLVLDLLETKGAEEPSKLNGGNSKVRFLFSSSEAVVEAAVEAVEAGAKLRPVGYEDDYYSVALTFAKAKDEGDDGAGGGLWAETEYAKVPPGIYK